MKRIALLLTSTAVAFLGTAAIARYELIAVPGSNDDRGYVYRMDRWTGAVALLNGKAFLLLTAEPVDTPTVKLPADALPNQDGVLSVAPNGKEFSFSTFNASPYTITSLTLSITYDADIGKVTRLFEIQPSYGHFSPRSQSNSTTFRFPHDLKGGATWKVVEGKGYIL